MSRWTALGMILAVLALIMASFSLAPVASADPVETTTTVPTTSKAPSTTAKPPTPATSGSPTATPPPTTSAKPPATSEAPATATTGTPTTEAPEKESTETKAPEKDSTAPTTPAEQKRQAARGLNPAIDVKITRVEVDNGTPMGDGQQIVVQDTVKISGTWDASNAAPQAGDEFTITFPAELQLTETADFSLGGTGNTSYGTCTVAVGTNVMKCVLSADVNGLDEVKGTFNVWSKAVKATDSSDVIFTISGQATPVKLPGGGGIGDGKVLGKTAKSGTLSQDKQAVRWAIDIAGPDLVALDTAKNGQLTLTDTLSANMELCGTDRLDAKLLAGRPGELKQVASGITITQNAAGDPVIIGLNNGKPFDPNLMYRVEYTSCTASGKVDIPEDPTGVITYNNSVDIGGAIVAAPGVGTKWRPETTPSKTGSLNQNDRYMKANWTVLVPGSSFLPGTDDKPLVINEQLTGAHAVCVGGLQPKIRQSNFLPGSDNSFPKPDITGQFNVTTDAVAGSTNFTVTFTPKAVGFKFDPKQYYYVDYQTCVDPTLGVPDSGDVFTNKATVNGASPTAEASGRPDYRGAKTGKVSVEPTMVAGQMQPAGTTMDWKVQISGNDLENAPGDVVVSDVLSGNMTVCEVGANLKANLNFKITAKDFRGGANALPDRDLTADTTVARTANGFDFTIPKQAGDFNNATRYHVEYTLCTTSGGMDDRGTVYENTLTYNSKTLKGSATQSSGGSGTGQGVTRGSFSLVKSADTESEKFPSGTEFTVQVEEFAPGKNLGTDQPTSAYKIKVKADGTPVSGFNPRGTGWQIRLTEVDMPTVPGVAFAPGKFLPAEGVTLNADATKAIVTITPKSNIAVKLVNKAVLGEGMITKTVIGNAAGELTGNESFVIKAVIEGNDTPREITLKAGQSYPLKDLPIGAKVTFTEVTPVNTDRITWSEPVITPKTLTIGTDATANTVTVTNEANITQGTFALSKKLEGPEASNKDVPKTYDVVATWTDPNLLPPTQTKTLTLPANGDPVPFGVNLPGGTKVTLTETVPANGNGLAWGAPTYTGDVVIDGDTGVVTIGKDPRNVTVVNYVDKNDGTLRVVKQVGGEAADTVGDDVEFQVEASWKDGVNYAKETLSVTKGVATPLSAKLPVGTEVTFTETGRPDVAGVEWGAIAWGTDPNGAAWLKDNGNGSVTGIVSDDPTEGRLITLTNEALWKFGSVEFSKFVLDGDNATDATDAGLPAGAEFQIRIDGIDPALPAGTAFPAVGETITLDAGNKFSYKSGDVLPRNTVITFSEVDPAALPGIDWARPYYWVAKDAGDAEFRDTVKIVPGAEAVVEIRNRIIPTTDVDISKIVTGPKGEQVMKDPSTTFQVTATWTDVDNEARSCVLDVKPGGSATPTALCDAPVIDGKVQFPLNTAINFVETGAHTDVTNVEWGEVVWGAKEGAAELVKIESAPTGTTVKLTGDANGSVVLGLENKSSSKGLIIIPLPLPIPPWGGGSWIPGWPGSVDPNTPGTNVPGGPGTPNTPGETGHNGAPGKPAPTKPDQSPSLPVTGANVIWLAGAALALIAGGAWLTLRNRKRLTGE